jgi:hypothetical protein
MWLEDWLMTLSGKLLSAAAIGGAATYLMQGDWSRRAKARAVASAVFGWAAAVIIIHIFPEMQTAADEVKMGLVGICCGAVGYVFDRLQRVSITAELVGVKIKSEGLVNGAELVGVTITREGKENAPKASND